MSKLYSISWLNAKRIFCRKRYEQSINQSIYAFLFQKSISWLSAKRIFSWKRFKQSINQSTHFYFKNLFFDPVQRESFPEKDLNNQSINLHIFMSKIYSISWLNAKRIFSWKIYEKSINHLRIFISKNLFLDSTQRESFPEKDMNNQSINESTHFYLKNLFLYSVQRESFSEKDINNQSINLRIVS